MANKLLLEIKVLREDMKNSCNTCSALSGHLLPALPPALSGLTELATDLRWTWSHTADSLWQQVDDELWRETHNPYVLLQNISKHRFDELAANTDFCQHLQRIQEERQAYLDRCGWYGETYPTAASGKKMAFFSMEYGLGGALPFYAGGLGILSGDVLKTASDLCIPMVGVGLLSLLSQRPIVPFRTRGMFEIFPRERALPRFFGWRKRPDDRLEVRFGEPVFPPPHEPGRTWEQAQEVVRALRAAVEAL